MISATNPPHKAEAYGEVTPPPDLVNILDAIRTAAESKTQLYLTAGEARVLYDHIALLSRGVLSGSNPFL